MKNKQVKNHLHPKIRCLKLISSKEMKESRNSQIQKMRIIKGKKGNRVNSLLNQLLNLSKMLKVKYIKLIIRKRAILDITCPILIIRNSGNLKTGKKRIKNKKISKLNHKKNRNNLYFSLIKIKWIN